ncbi:MAG: PEP-CTERM sorting domain-containing protein [Stellaceae bacterium]
MNTLRKSLTLVALAVAAGSASQAHAEIFLTATDGVTTASVNDLATPGIASYSGEIGNFTASIDVGTGYPAVGQLTQPTLDLTSLDLTTGTAGGTLTVSLSETGFTSTDEIRQFLSDITGVYTNSHATMSTYFDASDTAFGTASLLSTGLLDNQSATVAVPPIPSPYSLTEIVTVSAGANSLSSIDAGIIDTPEPGSLALLGSALLALVGIGWRRSKIGRRRPAVA